MNYKSEYTILKQIMRLFSRSDCSPSEFFTHFCDICVSGGICRAMAVHATQPEENILAVNNLTDEEILSLKSNEFRKSLNLMYSSPHITEFDCPGLPSSPTLFPVNSDYMLYGTLIVFLPDSEKRDIFVDLFTHLAAVGASFVERFLLKPSFSASGMDLMERDELTRIIDSIPEPVFYKDSNNRYRICNRAFEDFTDTKSSDIIGKTGYDILPGQQTERHTGTDSQVIRTGRSQKYESDYDNGDGSIRHMLVSKNPLFNREGEIVGSVGVINDITTLKRVEQQYEEKNASLMKINAALLATQKEILEVNRRLTESEEKYRLLIENQREFVIKLDITGQIIYTSNSFDKFVSLTFDDKNSYYFQDLLMGGDRVKFETLLRDVSINDNETEIEVRIKVGTTFMWISWSFKSVQSTARDLDFIVGVGRDVTMRKKAEVELENYRSLLEAAFAQSPNPLMLIKYPDKTIMIINEAAQRFFELAQDSYEDKSIEEIDFPDEVFFAGNKVNISSMLGAEKIYYDSYSSVEIRTRHSSGRELWGLLYATPIYNRIGELISYLMIFPEITDLKEAEKRIDDQSREMQKMQKLESIGVLAGGIAHDFNNILGAVMGNISLARFYGGDDKISTLLSKAENAISRAKELTNQLLTFSKGGSPVRKTASLNEIVRDSALFSIHGSKAVIEFVLDNNLKPGLIDTAQVSQVIQNLVMNASQSMPAGGAITIKTENYVVVGNELPVDPGDYVKVTISDTGCGVDPEIADRIFDPFFSTKEDGNGLGLATSYNIIKRHNGYINFDSSPGGTDFYVYLPVSSEGIAPALSVFDGRDNFHGRVLLMDDDSEIRDVGRNLLKIIGFDVQTVDDGAELLRIVTQARGQDELFDLYIMDLTVPGGMGGKETTEELLKIVPDARVIVSSGYANNEVLSEYRRYGFCGVLEKPYTITDVKNVLKEINYA
jgi:PAS domain S-box-containing protein